MEVAHVGTSQMRATTDASKRGLPVRLRNIRCNDLDETHAMTDRRTIDRRGTNHKQRTAYLLEDWLKDPAW